MKASKVTTTKPQKTKKSIIERNLKEEPLISLTTNDDKLSWFRTLVLFGDSSTGLFVSFLFFLISLGVAVFLDQRTFLSTRRELTSEEHYHALGPVPLWIETSVPVWEWKEDDPEFIKYMKERFHQDGVVALRGILDLDLLGRLDQASSHLVNQQFAKSKGRKPRGALTGRPQQPQGTQFFTVNEGVIFLGLNSMTPSVSDEEYEDDGTSGSTTNLAFLDVALQSKIPEIISRYLLEIPTNETLRMMRDIFLAKDTDEYVCGWHVDDTGFWPADADADGVNAWIALDDMPTEGGGGFALAVGSHTAEWKHDAYHVTGSTHTFPPEGFTSARDTVERRVGNGTCNIATAAPHLHRRMEDTKRIYEVKRGDVIFHTRWLFHRTVPFENETAAQHRNQEEEAPLVYRRYSLRYGPGSSRIPRGYGTELSVLWDSANAGRMADEVAQYDLPWYPQAWPPALDKERTQLEKIATERLTHVMKIADSRRQQLRRARRARHQTQPH